MSNVTMIENYLAWKRDKEIYPPQNTPEEWANELLMSEAYARLNMIKDLIERDAMLDPVDFANQVYQLTYDPLEVLLNEQLE